MLDLRSPRRVHIVGVGGAGMSAIAMVLRAMGHAVSGSDLRASSVLSRLEGLGVHTRVGHHGSNVEDADMVAISSAVGPSNPEVSRAMELGIPVLSRSRLLAAICATRQTIAVAGTHGKTTTSSMLALILLEGGSSPSFVIGGDIARIGPGAAWGGGPWLVVEADESDGTFLELPAYGVVVTNVEPDHVEHYGGMEELRLAFERFVLQAPGPKVLCADDPCAASLRRSEDALTYGFTQGADIRIAGWEAARSSCRFELVRSGEEPVEVCLAVPGRHNALNAAAAWTMARALGVEAGAARRALARYGGVARRFEFRGRSEGVTYVDDYAHLPGEVRAALAAARDGGFGRVVAVFQPHRYSRTEALCHDFADAFELADIVMVTEIYSAGEAPRPGVSGRMVADAVREAHPDSDVRWLGSRDRLAEELRSTLRSGDVCLTMGAGDLTGLPSLLLGEVDRW